jgi:hypothetical protein
MGFHIPFSKQWCPVMYMTGGMPSRHHRKAFCSYTFWQTQDHSHTAHSLIKLTLYFRIRFFLGHPVYSPSKEWMENEISGHFHGCGQGDPGVLVDSRVDGLSNRIGFTEVAAPRACYGILREKTR